MEGGWKTPPPPSATTRQKSPVLIGLIMSTKSEADIDDEVKLKIKQLTEEQQKLKEVFLSKELALQKETD